MTETRPSWLIQRLLPPTGSWIPFAFGGGYHNGGCTDDEAAVLAAIFGVDYMGAAEFEFGALPKALASLRAAAPDLVTWTIAPASSLGRATLLYVVSLPRDAPELSRRLVAWATRTDGPPLKESTNLGRALAGDPSSSRVVGWLDVDDGLPFCFFTDETMFREFCAYLGVTVSSAPADPQ